MTELSTAKEIPQKVGTYGLIMIKPHAFQEVADVVIGEMFSGESWTKDRIASLRLTPETKTEIFEERRLTVCKKIIRTLDLEKHLELMKIFYGRDQDSKHWPALLDLYKGEIAFLTIHYDGSEENLRKILKELKGEDPFQEDETSGTGLRGVLLTPKKRVDLGKLETLSDDEYKKAVPQVINNAIHVTDGPHETAMALKLLLSEQEIDEAQTRGYDLGGFIKKHEA